MPIINKFHLGTAETCNLNNRYRSPTLFEGSCKEKPRTKCPKDEKCKTGQKSGKTGQQVKLNLLDALS